MQLQINNNGDTPETIRQQAGAILDAVEQLKLALSNAWPHGRNYQTVEHADIVYQEDIAEIATAIKSLEPIANIAQSMLLIVHDYKHGG